MIDMTQCSSRWGPTSSVLSPSSPGCVSGRTSSFIQIRMLQLTPHCVAGINALFPTLLSPNALMVGLYWAVLYVLQGGFHGVPTRVQDGQLIVISRFLPHAPAGAKAGHQGESRVILVHSSGSSSRCRGSATVGRNRTSLKIFKDTLIHGVGLRFAIANWIQAGWAVCFVSGSQWLDMPSDICPGRSG
jgi:hypothetical protein